MRKETSGFSDPQFALLCYCGLTHIFLGPMPIWQGSSKYLVVDDDTMASVFLVHPIHSGLEERETKLISSQPYIRGLNGFFPLTFRLGFYPKYKVREMIVFELFQRTNVHTNKF